MWTLERLLPPPSPLKAKDEHGHVLYLSSLSKTLNPGLRIGWIVGPEPVIERLSNIKMQTDYGSSSLSQRVATEWLTSGLYEQHLESVREQLKIRRTVSIGCFRNSFKRYINMECTKGRIIYLVRNTTKTMWDYQSGGSDRDIDNDNMWDYQSGGSDRDLDNDNM